MQEIRFFDLGEDEYRTCGSNFSHYRQQIAIGAKNIYLTNETKLEKRTLADYLYTIRRTFGLRHL